jgi:phosphodiesterase/alkaline phosphatase D-like protein
MCLPAGKISPFGRNDNMGEGTISWLSTQMEHTQINWQNLGSNTPPSSLNALLVVKGKL